MCLEVGVGLAPRASYSTSMNVNEMGVLSMCIKTPRRDFFEIAYHELDAMFQDVCIILGRK